MNIADYSLVVEEYEDQSFLYLYGIVTLILALLAIISLVIIASLIDNSEESRHHGNLSTSRRRKPRPRTLDLSMAKDIARRAVSAQQLPLVCPNTPTPAEPSEPDSDATSIGASSPVSALDIKTPLSRSDVYENSSYRSPSTPRARAINLPALARMMESQLGPLPSEWSLHLSNDRRIFFFDKRTGVSTWRDPRIPPTSPPLTPVRKWVEHVTATISGVGLEERNRARMQKARVAKLRRDMRMARLQKISGSLMDIVTRA